VDRDALMKIALSQIRNFRHDIDRCISPACGFVTAINFVVANFDRSNISRLIPVIGIARDINGRTGRMQFIAANRNFPASRQQEAPRPVFPGFAAFNYDIVRNSG